MSNIKSEFEKYFKENHADSFYSVDAALEMRGDDYIDFHAADLWALWQHQQTKVDELTKQRDSFIKAYEIEMGKSIELQKRVDAAHHTLTDLKEKSEALHHRWHILGDSVALAEAEMIDMCVKELDQALKGGGE